MAESIYNQIGKQVGRDVRLVRAAAHHPFEFFSNIMKDPLNHRPMRFRYLGVFFVKPYWRKGLRNVKKIGAPPEGAVIWARVPVQKFNRTYINLKFGTILEGVFTASDGSACCPVSDIQFWVNI